MGDFLLKRLSSSLAVQSYSSAAVRPACEIEVWFGLHSTVVGQGTWWKASL